jgi:spore maturation protein CgeB
MFLEPGHEVLVATDGGEVANLLNQLTPERTREIGLAAKARILRDHTYKNRVNQLEEVLNSSRREQLPA